MIYYQLEIDSGKQKKKSFFNQPKREWFFSSDDMGIEIHLSSNGAFSSWPVLVDQWTHVNVKRWGPSDGNHLKPSW